MKLAVTSPIKPLPWQQQLWQGLITQHQKRRLPHALLFSGIAGTGKQYFACSLAQFILCQHPQPNFPCQLCTSCLLFNSANHPDYFFLQAESGSTHLKIDALRLLITDLQQTAQQGGYKVVILSADELNIASANALLKTLEEPTSDTIIILLSNEQERLLPTIRSRCQVIQFAPTWSKGTQEWLEAQGVSNAQEWLNLAEGAPLYALQFAQDEILRTQYHDFLIALQNWWQKGDLFSAASAWQKTDTIQCVIWLWQIYLDLLRLHINHHDTTITHEAQRDNLLIQIAHYSQQQLLTIIAVIQAHLTLLRQNSNLNLQLQLEALLIEIQHA